MSESLYDRILARFRRPSTSSLHSHYSALSPNPYTQQPVLYFPDVLPSTNYLKWRRLITACILGSLALIMLSSMSTLPSAATIVSASLARSPALSRSGGPTKLVYPDFKKDPQASRRQKLAASISSLYISANSRVERNENVTFNEYLLQHFNPNHVTPFVSLVDKNYAKEGINFQLKLREFRMDNPVVLICADEACMDYAEERGLYAYGGYFRRAKDLFAGQMLYSRAGLLPWIKFNALRDLARDGWTNVWFEGDVYLTGNPFTRMLQLEERWDIQFTLDGGHRTNFGWMYTRSCDRAITFWQRALEEHLRKPEVWDQQVPHDLLNDAVYTNHESDKTFSRRGHHYQHKDYTVWVLHWADFRAWHWGGLNPGERDVAVYHHLTGVWGFIRPHVAYEFGWKGDVDNYYSSPPDRIITSSAMTGNLSEVTQQARILLSVAKATNRSLWLPREVAPAGLSHTFMEVFPIQVPALHLKVLEGKYFEHAAKYVPKTRLEREPSQRLPVKTVEGGIKELISRVKASSAFSVSLEDWFESDYRRWRLTEETLGESYIQAFAELYPCTDWQKPLHDRGYYWCGANIENGHTNVVLDMNMT